MEAEDPSLEEIVALMWFEQAGDKGLPVAHFELAQDFLSDPEFPDDREGLHFLGQAAAAGYGPAQKEVGKRFAQGSGPRQSDFDAAVWLTKAKANREDVEELLTRVRIRLSAADAERAALDAQRTIDPPFVDRLLVFRTAKLIPPPGLPRGWFALASASVTTGECETGLDLYARARAQGNTEAMVSLAELYEIGWCLPRSDRDAATLYLEASEAGEEDVWPILGYLYLNGIGVQRDPERARYWFKGAVLDGAFPIDGDEGWRIERLERALRGRPMPDALLEEVEWVRQLETSSDQVKFEIAIRVRDGNELPANNDVAHSWLIRSDFPEAKLERAVGTLAGRYGTTGSLAAYSSENKKAALRSLRFLTEDEYAPAQRELGLHFAAANNFYAACVWLLRAGANGADVSNVSSNACAQLSPADLENAKRLSKDPMPVLLP
jgi:TPR repeat protein